MPENHNPYVSELLSWHGHSRGGVHLPFQTQANPLGGTIATGIVVRLRQLATSIASGANVPRWVFLVGGPGNGKSETVQDFLTHLDTAMEFNGELIGILRSKFAALPLVPRRVEVLPTDLQAGQERFAGIIGRIVVVQDATATESAGGNAARELAEDVLELLTGSEQPPPVFIVCANRGLLARALNEAFKWMGGENEATRVFKKVIGVTSLGQETWTTVPSCWPLADNERFACWPLDVESLLITQSSIESPLNQVVSHATDLSKWETPGACLDCNARACCPFRQNAEWLREPEIRSNLVTILRRGELARGQRWNFRDAFSLVAELIVGQWSDFSGEPTPCEWVHKKAQHVIVSSAGVSPALALVRHLYPHALFGADLLENLVKCAASKIRVDIAEHPFSASIIQGLRPFVQASAKPIRDLLRNDYGRLDPAVTTPANDDHDLRLIEDAFSQSINLGRASIPPPGLAPIEHTLFQMLEEAESEWDALSRDYSEAIAATCFLRQLAAMLCKRSIGVRRGLHGLEDFLQDYEASLRDTGRLAKIKEALQQLLGDGGFLFNLTESFGQPQAEGKSLICLEGATPGIRAFQAPVETPVSPGHDMPCFEVTGTNSKMPLTFDFYLALRLRGQGCASSSLPASVRASLDRVRHKYAGQLCRKKTSFADGQAKALLGGEAIISLQDENGAPVVSPA
jgi:hypothetical protein